MPQVVVITNRVLEGRVAQVLNERELAINIGEDAGVTTGMKFAILAENALEIRDPVSHTVLDVIDREKVRVEAIEVRRLITICRTYRTHQVGGDMYLGASLASAALGNLSERLRPPREVRESLRATEGSFPPPLEPKDSFVKPNDRVVAVVE